MLGPGATRFRATEFGVKRSKASTHPRSVSAQHPAGGSGLERLPILIAGVSIAEFGRIDYPSYGMCAEWPCILDVPADSFEKILNLCLIQSMLEREQRQIFRPTAHLTEFRKVTGEALIPLRKIRGASPTTCIREMRAQTP